MTEREQMNSQATSARYRARQRSWQEARREVFESLAQADEIETATTTQGDSE